MTPNRCHYLVLLILFASSLAHGSKVQKWVDEDGQVHYGEAPPEYAKSQKLDGRISSIKNDNVQADQVTLYSTSWCGYCKKARTFLQKNRIAFTELDIERDSFANRRYKSMGGRGVPFLAHGENTLQGFNPDSYKRFFKLNNLSN